MRILTLGRGRSSAVRRPTRVVTAAALCLGLAGFAASPVVGAGASTLHPHVTPLCNATVTAGTGTVTGLLITGITAGSTQIKFDCNASAGAAFTAEASLFGAIGSFAVNLAAEADVSALGNFAAPSASDTGCPAGTGCSSAVFAVPATFAASDPHAQCPPTPAQFNAGMLGCVIAVATASQQPVFGAEYVVSYASQTTPPAAPTIAATVSTGPPGTAITVSDAPANKGYWWADAIQFNQAVALDQTPANSPADCGPSGGYGTVPASFLKVNWFAAGSSTAIAGSTAGINISNDCYDTTTLFAPVLSGTITAPASLAIGTNYTAYLCELNATPFPSNDANAATNCGTAPSGTTWIDASFSFAAANLNGTPQAALSVTSVAGTLGTPLTLTTSGGSGTGTVTYSVVDGTATGCTVTGGALSAQGAGTCIVTASKAGDATYLSISSTPTTVSLVATPVLSFTTTKVRLTGSAKTLPIKVACAQADCSGRLSARVVVVVKKKKSTITMGSASLHVTAGSSATATIHLSAAMVKYLKANPKHPTLQATLTYVDSSGKYTKTGHVTLMK